MEGTMAGKYFPDAKLFRQKARKGGLTPICRELPADLDTPVSLFLKLDQLPPAFLLESVERGENVGRYSFMGLRHSLLLESKGNQAIIRNDSADQKIPLEGRDPLHLIQEILSNRQAVRISGLPPSAVGPLAIWHTTLSTSSRSCHSVAMMNSICRTASFSSPIPCWPSTMCSTK
jgi:hypothetical protein